MKIFVLAIALPSLRISPLLRIAAIVLFYAAAMSFIAVYIQSIGSGMGIFSELFNNFLSVQNCTVEEISLLLFSVVPIKPSEDPSLEGPSHKLTKEEKEALSLSEELKQIFVGLLLGDLYAQKPYVNARFIFKQGVVHKDYIFHLYELFKNYCLSAPRTIDLLADKRTGKVYSYVVFRTLSLPCFNDLYEVFYPMGNKIIPLNIGSWGWHIGCAMMGVLIRPTNVLF